MEKDDIIYILQMIAIVIIVVIAGFALSMGIHTIMRNDALANETLIKAGFTDPVITGIGYFDCSRDDISMMRFEATNPQGIRVQGTVCCGLLKRCTIRY
jgi:hypothetical protein